MYPHPVPGPVLPSINSDLILIGVIYRDNGKSNGNYYSIGIMENQMETTIV